MLIDSKCPFKVGECVVYRPSQRGYDLTAMFSQRLAPDSTYKVKAIQEELYVLVEGSDHPAGGLYWTEFEGCKA